jgi:hypothetical protein
LICAVARMTRAASDALLQSIDLAIAAEELGTDCAFSRVHHYAVAIDGVHHAPHPRPLPVRRRRIRDRRAADGAAELPLLAMPQAAWLSVSQPRSRAGKRFSLAARRASGQVLRKPTRLSARVLQRMRLADHQPQWAELEAAGGISRQRVAAIRRCAGAARRSAGAAGAALLRRQHGAVVRDHRRSAAISGISAGLGP